MRKNLIRSLADLDRERPVDAATLHGLGISSALASYYVGTGWLTRLGTGCFAFPNATLDPLKTVTALGKLLPSLHVGGKSALALRGVTHNVALGQPRLIVWGKRCDRLPAWVAKTLPIHYVTHEIFAPETPDALGISPLSNLSIAPKTSTRERALLEMLDDVGCGQGIEEAQNIMENLHSIRHELLNELLFFCKRKKIILLCRQWANELKLPWANQIKIPANKFADTSNSRWVSRTSDNTTLILKP